MSEHLTDDGQGASLAGRLRDLHLPEPVAGWPPAPGWWALGAAVLVLGLWAGGRIRRRRRARRHATPVQLELQACYAEWHDTRDTTRYYLQGARALRRVAIGTGGRAHVARLHGERWVDWLERQATEPFSGEVREVLADAGYRRRPPECVAAVHRELLRWVGEQEVRDA